RAFLDLRSIHKLYRCGRSLDDKIERFIRIYGKHYGEYFAHLVLCAGVELLTKLHDVHTLGAERRTYWRRGVGLSALYLELYIAGDFFSHCFYLLVLTNVPDFLSGLILPNATL